MSQLYLKNKTPHQNVTQEIQRCPDLLSGQTIRAESSFFTRHWEFLARSNRNRHKTQYFWMLLRKQFLFLQNCRPVRSANSLYNEITGASRWVCFLRGRIIISSRWNRSRRHSHWEKRDSRSENFHVPWIYPHASNIRWCTFLSSFLCHKRETLFRNA